MKIALLPALLLLAAGSSGHAQATPDPAATPAAAAATASPATDPVPVATLPNLHRIVRDLKTTADNIKSQGSFGAQLWLIADARSFHDWQKPASPSVDPVDTAVRGQPLFTAIVFYGPAADEKGQANVMYDLVVRRPDGSVYSERKDLVGYQGASPADERMVMLGRNYLNITIGPDDPTGKYTVAATVRDEAGKVKLSLQKEFLVP